MNEQSSQSEAAARHIVETLAGAGFQALYAGGCVRDQLLGLAPKDYDVATSALPEVVLQMFPKTFAVGANFGVVLVVTPCADGAEITTEVATFRHDGVYSDGRRPDAVTYSSDPRQDVERRDFTINGMLFDPLRGELLDFVGGRRDLEAGMVRAIGDPLRRFREDRLRMLRAVRFAARFGFSLEAQTASAIRQEAPGIRLVSPERVRDELTRMLTEGHARRAFELLDSTGLLHELLPEVERMQGVAQPPEYHPEGDVWLHTLQVLAGLEAGAPARLAWAALLHDVGKPATYSHEPGDRIRFNGHAEVGARMAAAACARLRMANSDAAQVELLVANHMRFGDVERMKESTLKRFFRLARFPEHLELHRLDCKGSHGLLRLHDYAKSRYEALPEEAVKPVLLVTGQDLIRAGYKPGPPFKELLRLAEDAQLEGRICSKEQGMALIARHAPVDAAQL